MEIETLLQRVHQWFYSNRRALFWALSIGGLLWFVLALKEVSSLLLLSYVIALVLDPVIERFHRLGLSRSAVILVLGGLVAVVLTLFVGIAIPLTLREYNNLVEALPGYLGNVVDRLTSLLARFGLTLPADSHELILRLRESVSQLGSEHLSKLGKAALDAVLRGYSLTLTIFNLLLLPFFIYYIARDLKEIHIVIGRFIRDDIEVKIKAMSDEILSHVYAFFRGQITVSLIMASLYMAGLWLAGLPYAFIVGLVSGLLNIVPYLGIGIGVLLAIVITLVTDPSLAQFAQVIGVFVAVQVLEGTVLTPKIVGGSVGIHPLLAMVALVVAGQLFGLLGLVIAIPGAAALRVLFQTLRREIDAAS